jgi:hypothetical protein
MKIIVPALCLTAACTTTENLGFREGSPTFTLREELPDPIDLLVVLDDTTAMVPHLADGPAAGPLGEVWTPMYNGAPDVRIAVTTTTTGQRRTSASAPQGFIEHAVRMSDGGLTTNYTGDIGSALGSLMAVGASSQSPNRIFASIDSALDGDFLRAGSGLGVLIVTASDDESTEDVATYAAKIRGSGRATAASAMYVDPVVRLPAFLAAFNSRHVSPLEPNSTSDDYSFVSLFRPQPVAKCVPDTASAYISGTQLDCAVVTAHEGVERALPYCDGDPWQADAPCYQLLADELCISGKLFLFGGPFRMYHPAANVYCESDPPQEIGTTNSLL